MTGGTVRVQNVARRSKDLTPLTTALIAGQRWIERSKSMSEYIDADFAVVCDEWRPTVTSGEE